MAHLLRGATPARRNNRTLYVPSGLVKPTAATVGPRIARTADARGAITGFNTAGDAQGVVTLTGLSFAVAGGLQFAGQNGGPNPHTKYVIRDCEFPTGAVILPSFQGSVDIAYSKGTYFGPGNPSGIMDSCNWDQTGNLDAQGRTAGIPQFITRNNADGTVGNTLSLTPWTFTRSIFKCGYPNLAIDATDPHYEAVHIKGAKQHLYSQCVFDVGYQYKPDNTTLNPDVTACFSIEGGYGGNDDVEVSDSWMYGVNQFGSMLNLTCTNFRFLRNRIGHIRSPSDTSLENVGRAGPGINFENFGQSSTMTINGNVWDLDSTPVAPGFLGRPAADGGNTTVAWA